MRGERGQTTAEYMGLLVVVAAIVAAVVSLGLPDRLAEAVGRAVCASFSDDPQVNCGPQA